MDVENMSIEDLLENSDNPQAAYKLALCYIKGEGVDKNDAQGKKYLELAAELGSQEAQELLSNLNKVNALPESITEETLPAACEKAENGDHWMQYLVGEYFFNKMEMANADGQTCEAQGYEKEARRYLEQAATKGVGKACLLLAILECNAGNTKEMLNLLTNARDCKIPQAYKMTGDYYAEVGDKEKAEEMYTLAADSGSAEDKLEMAVKYMLGDVVPQSEGKALSWVNKAIAAGMPDAQERLNYELERPAREAEEKRQQEERERIARAILEEAERQARIRRGIPLFLCVDCSFSMCQKQRLNKVKSGIRSFLSAASLDSVLRDILLAAVITYGKRSAEIQQPVELVSNIDINSALDFKASGETPLADAVQCVGGMLDNAEADEWCGLTPPWIVFIGDGDDTSGEEEMQEAEVLLRDLPEAKILCVGAGAADELDTNSLAQLSPEHTVIYVDNLNFEPFFAALLNEIKEKANEIKENKENG